MQDDSHHFLVQCPFEGMTKIVHIANNSVPSDGVSPVNRSPLGQGPVQQMRERHMAEHHAVVAARNEMKFDMSIAM